MEKFDFIIIGGGITGLSVGYELSKNASVLVLEQEEQPGYHATGRSAALFSTTHGSDQPAIFSLTRASGKFYFQTPDTFCEHPLLTHRGMLMIAEQDKQSALKSRFMKMKQLMPDLKLIEQAEINSKHPSLISSYTQNAIYDDSVYDIDVHGLQEGFIKGFRQQGGVLSTKHRVQSMVHKNNSWTIETNKDSFQTTVVVNAAGAWADEVALLAGVHPVGLQPLRRTVILLDPEEDIYPDDWPFTLEMDEQFYIKPDAGKILVSPADETLSVPCDAQPEEIDVAYAVHYAEQALGLKVNKVNHSWSGLRTFVEDRNPVIGYSKDSKGFFWHAAVGGFGIQTAPAAGRLAASLILNKGIPKDIAQFGLKEEHVLPERYRGNEQR